MPQKTIVISLGGSVIIPDEIDYEFLLHFKALLKKFPYKFIVVVGGGRTARKYIEPLRKAGLNYEFQDWIGIEVTRLNAKLVSLFLGFRQDIPRTIDKFLEIARKQKISVLAGIKPGTTTDGVASSVAAKMKADFFINITNVKGLYNKDPTKFKDAELIREITYKQMQRLMPKKQSPGQHFIIDGLALKNITKNKIKTYIINKDLRNLENLLKGKKFTGTLIH